MLLRVDMSSYVACLLLCVQLCVGLAEDPDVVYKESLGEEIDSKMPDIELEDGKLDPEQMGHINLASAKPGQCPEIACPVLKAPKPCPHAKPQKNVFRWMEMDCPGCPLNWDPKSCDKPAKKGKKGEKVNVDDVECPDLKCPAIKEKKPCKGALPVINKVIWRGKECRGCPTHWNPDSCDPEKRSKMDIREQEPFLDDLDRIEL